MQVEGPVFPLSPSYLALVGHHEQPKGNNALHAGYCLAWVEVEGYLQTAQ